MSKSQWSAHGIPRPGKPTENAFVESFNGMFRAECLNAHWFTSLTQAQQIVETWRRHYYESSPHAALGDLPPSEFASKGGASSALPGSARPGIFTR